MLKLIGKGLLPAFLWLVCMIHCSAQTNTVSTGNWSDPTVWSTGVVPVGTTTVNVNNPLVLDQNITVTTGYFSIFQNVTDPPGGVAYTLTATVSGGTLDIKAGTTTFEGTAALDNSTVFVRTGATLIVGPLTMNNNTTVTVEAGGTLIVNGDFNNNNNGTGTFNIAGLVQVNGNYTAAVGSVNLTGAGNFFTTGVITTNGSSDVFGSTKDCGTGPCSGNNLCNFSNVTAAAQTLCSGSTPAGLTGDLTASSTYLWESSTTSALSGFAAAGGTNNSQNYTPGALAQTTWYRRSVTKAGCTGVGFPVQITVAPSVGGWKGTTNNWNTASNWCNNTVPTSTTDVSISTGVPNQPQITAASFCQSLVINSGASVTLTGGNTFSISGNVTNNGSFSNNNPSVVTLASTTMQQTIGGSNPVTFDQLTINNSFATSPQITLTNFATVNTTLTMTAGNINLSGYNLTLGTSGANTGTLFYSTGWFYNGDVTRWVAAPVIADGNSRGLFPLGTSTDTRPMYVSFPSTTPTTAGTIRVGHTGASTKTIVSVSDPPGTIVLRQNSFWQISSATPLAGGTYDLLAEGTGFGAVGIVDGTDLDLRLMLLNSVVGSPGVNTGLTTDPAVLRTGLTLANLTNSFYVGTTNAVNTTFATTLPITLTAFSAVPGQGVVTLKWRTESELNFDYFQLERSSDGQEFQVIGIEKGMGTKSTPTLYTHLDTDPLGKGYYRLKIVDLDGTSSFSRIILVNSADNPSSVVVYPNPITNRKFTIDFNDGDSSNAQIILIDMMGRNYMSQEVETPSQVVELPAAIAPGIYFVKVFHGLSQKTFKVIVN